jgi:hypothetical protein
MVLAAYSAQKIFKIRQRGGFVASSLGGGPQKKDEHKNCKRKSSLFLDQFKGKVIIVYILRVLSAPHPLRAI